MPDRSLDPRRNKSTFLHALLASCVAFAVTTTTAYAHQGAVAKPLIAPRAEAALSAQDLTTTLLDTAAGQAAGNSAEVIAIARSRHDRLAALMETDPAGAAEAFRHAADLQPTESRPRYLAGYALEHGGQFAEAGEQYRAALAISPKDYEYQFALGRVLLRTNDPPGAEEHFREAVAIRGDSAPARLGLANALFAEKKVEAGADALAEYLKLNPGDRAEHFERASALMDLDRFDDALAELDRAEAGSAPRVDGLKMRADIYLHQNKWKEASVTLTEAVRQSPQDQQLLAWLGHVEIEMHDYLAAINILGKVVANNPQDTDTLRELVNAFFLHEDYAATIGAMDRLAKLETPKPASWFVRAICYDKLSRKAEAIEAYQKFLELDNGQNETQDFQARRRAYTLQSELGQTPKKQKR